MQHHVRIARPVADLAATRAMYCAGLGLAVLGSFEDHDGFDGVMLGEPGAGCHFEFTSCRDHPVAPVSTVEDLVVFYIPSAGEWEAACARMAGAGFRPVRSFNPYWEVGGRTYVDRDGYRVVLHNSQWGDGDGNRAKR